MAKIVRIVGTRGTKPEDMHVDSSLYTLTRGGYTVPPVTVVGDNVLYASISGIYVDFSWGVWDVNVPAMYPTSLIDRKYFQSLSTSTAIVKSAFDTQEGGSHYSSKPDGYQPFQISKALDLNPVEHTVLKYLLRHREKNGKVDLLKAKHCLDILIEQEYPDALAP